MFRVWEEIIINPPPEPGSILPVITDWHEEIHDVSFDLPFSWSGGSFTIHDPTDPTGPPIVEVPGEMSADGSAIWFGPFPMVVIQDPLPVWIHKELVYTGDVVLTQDIDPITITVWEHATTPEPSSIVMAIMGLLGLMGFGWMRRRDS